MYFQIRIENKVGKKLHQFRSGCEADIARILITLFRFINWSNMNINKEIELCQFINWNSVYIKFVLHQLPTRCEIGVTFFQLYFLFVFDSTVIPFVIFPKKWTFYKFSVGGTWQRPTVWTINIYIHYFW